MLIIEPGLLASGLESIHGRSATKSSESSLSELEYSASTVCKLVLFGSFGFITLIRSDCTYFTTLAMDFVMFAYWAKKLIYPRASLCLLCLKAYA